MRTRDDVVVQQSFFLPYIILDLSFTIRRQLNSEPPCKLPVVGWVLSLDLQIDCGAEMFSSVNGLVSQLLFNAEDLVELGQTLTSRWGTRFLLAVRGMILFD